MKIYALLLSVMVTINSIVPYAMLSNSYYFDRYGWSQALADGLQQFIYDGAGAIRDLIESADTNPWLDGNNSLVKKEDPVQTPAVNYYNESSNTTSVDMRTYTYNQKTYNTTLNNTYQMVKKDYNTTYDLRTYSYNPVYNDYRSYDYRTYNQYTFYDDDNYYYITENNITNQNYYIINKYDVNDNRFYSYYFEVNDTPSWNLTVDDLLGIYFNHDNYYYTRLDDTSDLLGLWHLDGNYNNELNNGISLHYGSSSFVDSRYDGGVKTDVVSTPNQNDACMYIDGFDEDSYTIEFWLWNMIQNGAYKSLGSTYAWHHIAVVYDASSGDNDFERTTSARFFLDGVEQPRGYMTQSQVGSFDSVSIVRFYDFNYVFGSTVGPFNVNSQTEDYINHLDYTPIYIRVSNVHSQPEVYNDRVYFGFTDNVYAGLMRKMTPVLTAKYKYINSSYYDPSVEFSTVFYSDRASARGQYDFGYLRLSNVNYVEMKECIMDEVRLSRGALYNGTFSVPLQKFDAGHIWVAPQGTNYNFGDMAYQTNINITDVRIGGAQYTYPQAGNVYIDLNSNGVGSSAAIYDGSVWLPLNYAVWNGYQWQDGKNFNFRNLTFYDVAVSSGEFDNDELREINEKLGLVDEKLGTGNDLLRSIVALLTTGGTIEGVEYSQADLSDMNNESVSAYNPLAENGSQVEGSLTSTLLSWKDVLLPFVIALILLVIVLTIFRIVIDLGVWVATLFSVAAVPTPSYDFNKGLQWFQGIPYEENGNIVEPFYVFTFGNVHFTLYDFCVIVFNVVFIGAMIKLGKRLIGNIKMKGE